ncbi:MAG: hypothetical protein ACRCV9_09985 [Burkholderiaceae bacterium]
MKEKPILFSAPMVRAILAGQKTQTRRVVNLPERSSRGRWEVMPWGGPNGGRNSKGVEIPFQNAIGHTLTGEIFLCPYGGPGDQLWVREACRAHEISDEEAEQDTYGIMDQFDLESPIHGLDGVVYEADGAFLQIGNTREDADAWGKLYDYRNKKGAKVPSIHMPRWASRITLEITGVRVELLQDISESDAVAEGVYFDPRMQGYVSDAEGRHFHAADPVETYAGLWESLNGAGSWEENPFVWVIEFKRVKP